MTRAASTRAESSLAELATSAFAGLAFHTRVASVNPVLALDVADALKPAGDALSK